MNEEQILIGMLLNNPKFIERVASKIKPEYFLDSLMGKIFEQMIDGNTNPPDIARKLQVRIQYFVEMQSIQPFVTKELVDSYGYYIFEQHKKIEISRLLKQEPIDTDAIEQIQKQTFFDVQERDESEEYLKNVEERYSGKTDTRNVPTGFTNIDSKIEGFRNSELVFVGARPGVGKTSFGMNLAYNMSKNRHKVLFCSLEMGAIELHERLVKSITKITDYREMTSDDFDRIVRTSKAIKDRLPLIIYDKAGMTIEDIICKCKEIEGLDVVVIDHLAILKSTKNFKSKYELVCYLTSRLKQLARELDRPVICLCQLNRGVEGRDIKSPTLADARDSGSVEEDGDIVAFIYRPEYHLSQREPDDETSQEHFKWENEMNAVRGKAEFIIAKNRRGYTGKFKLGFDGQSYTFYEREY